jgi:hypothetical protein
MLIIEQSPTLIGTVLLQTLYLVVASVSFSSIIQINTLTSHHSCRFMDLDLGFGMYIFAVQMSCTFELNETSVQKNDLYLGRFLLFLSVIPLI